MEENVLGCTPRVVRTINDASEHTDEHIENTTRNCTQSIFSYICRYFYIYIYYFYWKCSSKTISSQLVSVYCTADDGDGDDDDNVTDGCWHCVYGKRVTQNLCVVWFHQPSECTQKLSKKVAERGDDGVGLA